MPSVPQLVRSYLKKVFCSHIGVGRSFQILEIPMYSSGSKLAAALIWNQYPNFEMASSHSVGGRSNSSFNRNATSMSIFASSM
ncbi:MAG: hypothetical protein QNI97_11045, partial [Desulfobacterales bacterium]|nr:hypothetical protein [Desulfobacterales bacterium]